MSDTTTRRENEIGALWRRISKKGDEYFTGEINGERVAMWPTRGGSEKAPAFRVLRWVERAGPAQPVQSEDIQF